MEEPLPRALRHPTRRQTGATFAPEVIVIADTPPSQLRAQIPPPPVSSQRHRGQRGLMLLGLAGGGVVTTRDTSEVVRLCLLLVSSRSAPSRPPVLADSPGPPLGNSPLAVHSPDRVRARRCNVQDLDRQEARTAREQHRRGA